MCYKESLQSLQDELVCLKKTYGKHVTLSKSKSEANAPFPVTITANVVTPKAARSFDIASIDLFITLEESILRLRDPDDGGIVGISNEGEATTKDVEEGIMNMPNRKMQIGDVRAKKCLLCVRVLSEDVPEQLRCKIGNDLEMYWRQRVVEVKKGYFLEGLLMRLQTGFVEFLLSVPGCVEAYEATDESGASARRFALVAPGPSSSVDDSTHLTDGGVRGDAEIEDHDEAAGSGKTVDEETDHPEYVFDEPLAKEVSMLKLRFGESHFKIYGQENNVDRSRAKFSASILPSDPDWEEGPLDFLGELVVLESGGLGVSLRLAPMVAILWNVKLHMEGVLKEEAARVSGQMNAGRALLKFVEGHIAEVVRQGEMALKGNDEHLHLIEKVEAGDDALFDSHTDHMPHGYAECSHDERSTADEEFEDETSSNTFVGDYDGMSPMEAFGMELEGLQLDNIDVVEGLQLEFQVACSRCKKSSSIKVVSPAITSTQVKSGASWDSVGSCPNCHHDWSISAFPKMIHESSNLLGWVKPHNCIPVDLLPSHFMVQCVCGSVTSLRGVQIGASCGKGCSRCNKAMALKYSSVAFTPQAQMESKVVHKKTKPSQPSSQGQTGSEVLFQVPIKVGEPLPAKGTCRHYHHSHRWLRFPCCGMRFPCDLCHEEHTDGHNMKWALRMVCGYCSLEQKLDERCSNCEKKLATTGANPSGRNTRYWEGGEGCRNKARLDRRDKHKYTNSKRKTRSNKASRVGPKPWKVKGDS